MWYKPVNTAYCREWYGKGERPVRNLERKEIFLVREPEKRKGTIPQSGKNRLAEGRLRECAGKSFFGGIKGILAVTGAVRPPKSIIWVHSARGN